MNPDTEHARSYADSTPEFYHSSVARPYLFSHGSLGHGVDGARNRRLKVLAHATEVYKRQVEICAGQGDNGIVMETVLGKTVKGLAVYPEFLTWYRDWSEGATNLYFRLFAMAAILNVGNGLAIKREGGHVVLRVDQFTIRIGADLINDPAMAAPVRVALAHNKLGPIMREIVEAAKLAQALDSMNGSSCPTETDSSTLP